MTGWKSNYKGIETVRRVEGGINPNIDFLAALLEHQSPSCTVKEQDFADWLIEYVKKHHPLADVKQDAHGNTMITQGVSPIYPCVVAHIDSAQDYNSGMQIFKSNNFIFGWDDFKGEQCGIGADDKCGVAFALEMLNIHPTLKVVFTVQEEVGGIGAGNFNHVFFKDCSFLIQLDRRSYSNDIIEHSNGCQLVSKKFKEALKPHMRKYDYSFNNGTFTDVGCFKDDGLKICCINVSAGYFNEHMSDEVIGINHYINAVNIGNEIITDIGWKKWEHHYAAPVKRIAYKQLPGGNLGRYYDWEDDYATSEYAGYPQGSWDVIKQVAKKKKEVYHSSPHWQFSSDDYEYIEDQLSTGVCAVCTSNKLIDLNEGEMVCEDCSSAFFIPKGKSLHELQIELDSKTTPEKNIL